MGSYRDNLGRVFHLWVRSQAAIALAMAALAVASCKRENGLRELTLGLSWVHQAQFAGEYYADQHGLYAQEGLRVSFVPASFDRDPMDEFLAGKYDFVIAQPDSLIKARLSGHKIKAVATTFRVHPVVFIALQKSGINEPQDFRGKKVGVVYSDRVILRAMLKKMSMDPSDVITVPRQYDIHGLEQGNFDVQGAWATNELLTARRAGLALNTILPYDYGITFYADLLVVRESLLDKEPELVQGFVRATLQGWARALQDPAESAKLTLRYNPKLNVDHEVASLHASAPLIHTGINEMGLMHPEGWRDISQVLLEEGTISEQPEVSDLFTTRFLAQANVVQ